MLQVSPDLPAARLTSLTVCVHPPLHPPPSPQTLDAFLCLHGREEEGGGSFLLGSTHSLAEVMTAG